MTVTPTMQKNMNTRVHHAKLGKPPRMADIMLATKAMTQASWRAVSTGHSRVFGRSKQARTHDADGDGGQGEGVANDASNAEGRGALAGVAVAIS